MAEPIIPREDLVAWYHALKKAYYSGTRTVSYGDKSVTYTSLAELKAAIQDLEEELFPERVQRRRYYASVDRGYNNRRR